jgi:hypothetical protein
VFYCEEYSFLTYDTTQSGRNLPTFRRNVLSGSKDNRSEESTQLSVWFLSLPLSPEDGDSTS